MSLIGLSLFIVLISSLMFAFVRGRFLRISVLGLNLNCTPAQYGIFAGLLCLASGFGLIGLWLLLENYILSHNLIAQLTANNPTSSLAKIQLIATQISTSPNEMNKNSFELLRTDYLTTLANSRLQMTIAAASFCLSAGIAAFVLIPKKLNVQMLNEKIALGAMLLCALVAVFITLGVMLSLITETLRFFETVPVGDFLFGLNWSPQTALREDQIGASGSFGIIPLFVGTLLITFIAFLIAAPIGLMSAIYMTEYASAKTHSITKPILEILAGIPTVVYGFFAALTLAPFIRQAAEALGWTAASESALAAGIVIGVMIIPFISSISDDVISAVPLNLREGSYALGATQAETIIKVVLPAALPGIASGFLLAISRAIGETMIVVMAAGLAANLTLNPLEAVTTITVQIVTLLVGDQEFDSAKTLAAFALGMALFLTTLLLNSLALIVVRKYQEQYE